MLFLSAIFVVLTLMYMCMMVLDFISVVKDILIGAAALTTAIVAIMGLKSWRRELYGKVNFEIARNLLRASYSVRDELQNSRLPFVGAWEFPPDYHARDDATRRQKADAWSFVYRNRWAPVRDALRELETSSLEAEVLWGADVRTATDSLLGCARAVRIAMEAIVENEASEGQNFDRDRSYGVEMRSAAQASPQNNENPTSVAVLEAINRIESLTKPHLRRN